jgi:predicted ester cyclase
MATEDNNQYDRAEEMFLRKEIRKAWDKFDNYIQDEVDGKNDGSRRNELAKFAKDLETKLEHIGG